MTMLFISAVTIGELRKGLIILPQSRSRAELETGHVFRRLPFGVNWMGNVS